MLSNVTRGVFAGVVLGIVIVFLFPGYIGYFFSGSGEDFVFVDFRAGGAYVTTVFGEHGILLPSGGRDFVGAVEQLYRAVQPGELSAVSSAIGESYTVSDIVEFASRNFVYDLSVRSEFRPLRSSLMPTEMLSFRTGVCGDYAFFYAAALLACCGEATVFIVFPEGEVTVGHVFAAYDGVVLGYTSTVGLAENLLVWYQVYPAASVLMVVLTRSGSSVFPVAVSLWTFSNRYTLYYPARVTRAVITVDSGGRVVVFTTNGGFMAYPPVVGTSTVYGGVVTVYGGRTYFLSDSMVGMAFGSESVFVHYYGVGRVAFYYGFVLSPPG